MKVSRGCAGASAVGVLVAIVVLVLSVTTARPVAKSCPACGSKHVTIVNRVEKTGYYCHDCFHAFTAPPSIGFSWVDAASQWLGN